MPILTITSSQKERDLEIELKFYKQACQQMSTKLIRYDVGNYWFLKKSKTGKAIITPQNLFKSIKPKTQENEAGNTARHSAQLLRPQNEPG